MNLYRFENQDRPIYTIVVIASDFQHAIGLLCNVEGFKVNKTQTHNINDCHIKLTTHIGDVVLEMLYKLTIHDLQAGLKFVVDDFSIE